MLQPSHHRLGIVPCKRQTWLPLQRSLLETGLVCAQHRRTNHLSSRVGAHAGSHMAVRRSSFLRSCMCIPRTREDDPLAEL